MLPEAQNLSAVILVMMEWDEERSKLVERLKDVGLAVRVFMTSPQKRPDELSPDEFVEAFA